MPDPLLNFRCDPDLRTRIERAAKAEGMTLSELIRDGLESWLEFLEAEHAKTAKVKKASAEAY